MDRVLSTIKDGSAMYDETASYLLINYPSILSEVVAKIKYQKNDCFNVLDVGCGTGNLLSLVREEYPNANLYGIDYSSDMLEIAKSKSNDRINYYNEDLFSMEQLPLPQFDVILISFVLHNYRSISDRSKALSIMNDMLAVNGQLIVLDLVKAFNQSSKIRVQQKTVEQMRSKKLSDPEIKMWLRHLAFEDEPLSVEETNLLIHSAGFDVIESEIMNDQANVIFTAQKGTTSIDVKAELHHYGVQPTESAVKLYGFQNPHRIKKTGNNGIFLSIGGLNAIVSIMHSKNSGSPYRLQHENNKYYLTKYNEMVNVDIEPIVFPDWASAPFTIHGKETFFSDYFVYEGAGFVHLGYNACSFSDAQKCKFCSVDRRGDVEDKNDTDICLALNAVLPRIPEDIHFCLGGGAYFPLSDNVAFFKNIIKTIRNNGKKNPIWVEMIPPSLQEIQELIDAGATSFGFNIEIWDNENRTLLCPGKSKFEIDHYLDACRYVIRQLGPNSVGSCLIVGLDDASSIKNAVDMLLSNGIQPCLLLLKDFDTDLGDYLVPQQIQRDYLQLSKYAAQQANKYNIRFSEFEGCLKCTCCTIMHDYQMINNI